MPLVITFVLVTLLTSMSYADSDESNQETTALNIDEAKPTSPKTSFMKNPAWAVAKLPAGVGRRLHRGRRRVITTTSVVREAQPPVVVVAAAPLPSALPQPSQSPGLCQIFFQTAQVSKEPPDFAKHSAAEPYPDEELMAEQNERLITWTSNHFRHVLQLTSSPPFTKGRYVTYVVQRGVSHLATDQSHYEAFTGELNRIIAIDPSLAPLLRKAQIEVPVVDLASVSIPDPRIIQLDPAPHAKEVEMRYRNTTGRYAYAFPYQALQLQAPGKIVWQANELQHVLYLRDVSKYEKRAQYATYVSTYTGEVNVTHADFLHMFMMELNRVRALDPQLDLAIKLAGIRL